MSGRTRIRVGTILLVGLLLMTHLPVVVTPGEAAGPDSLKYIYVIPSSHLDTGYTDSQDVVAAQSAQHIDEALDKLDQYPEYSWTIEQSWQLEQWLARNPSQAQLDRFLARVQERRLAFGGAYVTTHSASLGHVQLDHLVSFSRYVQARLGIGTSFAFQNDNPGYTAALPQVLAASGLRYLVNALNLFIGGGTSIPRNQIPFYWQGPDGSKVLTWVAPQMYIEGWIFWKLTADYATMRQGVATELQKLRDEGYNRDSVLVMLSADNEGPNGPDLNADALMANVARYNAENPAGPKMRLATPDLFFQHLESVYGSNFPTYRGDWGGLWETARAQYPNGVALNRWTQEHLPVAEWLSAVNRLDGAPYPRDVLEPRARSWPRSTEHNNLGTGDPGKMTRAQLEKTNQLGFQPFLDEYYQTGSVLDQGLDRLGSRVRTARASLLVVNPHSWARSDLVTAPLPSLPVGHPFTLRDAATNQVVPYQSADPGTIQFLAKDVPALGYKRFDISLDEVPPPIGPSVVVTPGSIENEYYRITIDAGDGHITSIRDKQTNSELVRQSSANKFNDLIKASFYSDSYGGGIGPAGAPPIPGPGAPRPGITPPSSPPDSGAGSGFAPAAIGPISVQTAAGAVGGRLTILHSQSALARSDITLYSGVKRIDFSNTLDRRRMAYVPNQTGAEVYYTSFPFELPYQSLQARIETPNNFLDPATGYLPGANVGSFPFVRALDLRDGNGKGLTLASRQAYLALIGGTTSHYGSSFSNRVATVWMRLLQKSDEYQSSDQGVIPLTPEPPNYITYQFDYSLTSDAQGFDPERATRFGAAYAAPLLVRSLPAGQNGPLTLPSQSFFSLDKSNVVLEEIKLADTHGDTHGGANDLILRLRELKGAASTTVTISTPQSLTSATLATLLEDPVDGPLPVNPLKVAIGARQILTVRAKLAIANGQQRPGNGDVGPGGHLPVITGSR